jgi:hypothetical protein
VTAEINAIVRARPAAAEASIYPNQRIEQRQHRTREHGGVDRQSPAHDHEPISVYAMIDQRRRRRQHARLIEAMLDRHAQRYPGIAQLLLMAGCLGADRRSPLTDIEW